MNGWAAQTSRSRLGLNPGLATMPCRPTAGRCALDAVMEVRILPRQQGGAGGSRDHPARVPVPPLAPSFNGRTPGLGPGHRGSIPLGAATFGGCQLSSAPAGGFHVRAGYETARPIPPGAQVQGYFFLKMKRSGFDSRRLRTWGRGVMAAFQYALDRFGLGWSNASQLSRFEHSSDKREDTGSIPVEATSSPHGAGGELRTGSRCSMKQRRAPGGIAQSGRAAFLQKADLGFKSLCPYARSFSSAG